MAWPGMNLALQWAACVATLAWAVWYLATQLALEFRPGSTAPNCHGCDRCQDAKADRHRPLEPEGAENTRPPAKLKGR